MTALGHIYKIICTRDPTFCYIGSTFNRLSKRFETHRGYYTTWLKNGRKKGCSCYPYFDKHGIENFKIVLIKSYEVCREHVKDRRHLEAYETLWINKHMGKCVNQVLPVDYLKKEKLKVYREKNKEAIAALKKVHYEKNKESIAVRGKEYREKNKETLAAKRKEYSEKNKESIAARKKEQVQCEFCKNYITKSHLLRHQRTTAYCIEIQNAN